MTLKENSKSNISKKNIAIVTTDLRGPVRGGGVGTACRALAEVLATHNKVTIFFVTSVDLNELNFNRHKLDFAEKNITLEVIPEAAIKLEGFYYARCSYAVYLHMKELDFDVIHFPDMHGLAFYSLLAKSEGLSFRNSLLIVNVHGITSWAKGGNHEILSNPEELLIDHIERRCLELADYITAPSQYIIDCYKKNKWKLSNNIFFQQYPLVTHVNSPENNFSGEIKEIIFLGRLETRKGLINFCQSLLLIPDEVIKNMTVTFIGNHGTAQWKHSNDYLFEQSKSWNFQWKVFNNLTHEEAWNYILSKKALVVIASLEESMGYTVLECINAKVPFIASSIPPFKEIINENDHEKVFFPNDAEGLKNKIIQIIKNGFESVNFAKAPTTIVNNWLSWHDKIKAEDFFQLELGADDALVTVCISHFNRHLFLRQCLESISTQDYLNYEVVLIDNASDCLETIEYLSLLKNEFQIKNWQLIILDNRVSPSELRNKAAGLARGEYLLFVDDDNVSKNNQLSTFISVAKKTNADVLTCAFDKFSTDVAPTRLEQVLNRWLPVGNVQGLSLFYNIFGDMNFFIKKSVFLKLGGLKKNPNIGSEDYEFLNRASLEGYKIQAIPEALFWYRVHENNFSNKINGYETFKMGNSPYYSIFENQDFKNLISISLAMWVKLFQSDKIYLEKPLFRKHIGLDADISIEYPIILYRARDSKKFQELILKNSTDFQIAGNSLTVLRSSDLVVNIVSSTGNKNIYITIELLSFDEAFLKICIESSNNTSLELVNFNIQKGHNLLKAPFSTSQEFDKIFLCFEKISNTVLISELTIVSNALE